jgi:hypothetical protein
MAVQPLHRHHLNKGQRRLDRVGHAARHARPPAEPRQIFWWTPTTPDKHSGRGRSVRLACALALVPGLLRAMPSTLPLGKGTL